MKNVQSSKKFLAILLALLLVISNFSSALTIMPASAAESNVTLSNGQIQKQSTANISPGVQQTKLQVSTEKGLLKIYNLDIDPKNEFVKFEAGLSHGKLAGFQTVRKQTELISKPGYEVVGGVNGDFYNTSNGIPIEAMIHNEEVIRSNGNRSVVGILKNGEVKIGTPRIGIEMAVTPQSTAAEPAVEEKQVTTNQPEPIIENESQAQNEAISNEDTNENSTENQENNNETKAEKAENETINEETSNEQTTTELVSDEPEAEQTKSVSAETETSAKETVESLNSESIKISSINRERGGNDIVLFTPFYDASTYTNNNGTEVILEGVTDILKPKGEVSAIVKEVRKEQGNTKLEEGQMVLSGAGTGKVAIEQLQPGDKVMIRTTVDAPWDQLEEAIGGMHKLVTNGKSVDSSDPYAHPRTAVGIKDDGSVFFTVIDGRQPGFSEGVDLTDLGKIMKDMGAVEALNLDGGGSTTFVARQPGDTHLSVVNSPSDGGERNVANSLLVVSKAPKGNLSHLTVLPEATNILIGSQTTFQVKGQDEYFNPAEITNNVSWSVDNKLGEFVGNGIFTAGNIAGTGKVIASVNGIEGKSNINVVDHLDSITLNPTQLALGQGETSKIKATGYIDGEKVISDETAFTYSIEGDIGTIDDKGNFKATNGTASGVIIVSFGDLVEEIKVDVGKAPIVLEDFEDGIAGWSKSGARYNSIDISAATDPVRFGEKSLRIDYDFMNQKGTSGVYAWPTEDIIIEGYPDKIGMWFYGAGDGHWIRAQMRDGNNAAFPVDFTGSNPGADWTGWKYIEADIPKGKATPLKLDLAVRVMQTSDAKKNAGTVYVDNIRAVYGESNDDLTNPTLTEAFPVDGEETPAFQPTISVIATDNKGGTGIDPSKIKMTLDGELVQHTYDPATGKISHTPELFLAGGYHTVKVQVKDGFENPAELSWSFFITAGSQYSIEGPEKVYAGGEFTLNVNGKGLTDLSKTKAVLTFDPKALQVTDLDSETEGVQIKAGSNIKPENIEKMSVNNETGEIIIHLHKLDENNLLKATDLLAAIPFKVGNTALENISVSLQVGEFTYIRGDVRNVFHLPYEAEVQHKYSLDAEGISVGSTTKLTVKNEAGQPVKDVNITLIEPTNLTSVATVKADSVSVHKSEDPASLEIDVLKRDQKVWVVSQKANMTEVYLPNGQKGFVTSEQVDISTVPNPLGKTDEKGGFSTDLIALSQLTLKLQAEKDGEVSAVKEVKVVPQIGEKTPEHIKLSWKQNPESTQSLAWRTNPGTKGTVVQYGKAHPKKQFEDIKVTTVEGTSYLLTDKAGEMRIHEVTLEKLNQKTTYLYRVGDGSEEGWSDVYSFTTEAKKDQPFTFLFTTDSQAHNAAGNKIYGDLLSNALNEFPESRFILHGGDIVDDGALMSQWEGFFGATEGIFANTPIHAVLGNHDVYGEGEHLFKSFFENPENGPEGQKEWVYSFDYGDVHFAMLNSETDSEGMKAQTEWLKQDMENTDKKWKVVMFHRAPYESNPLRGTDATRAHFAPVIEELGIDLALVGHDHSYARTHAMKNGQPVEAGNGTVYIIGGSSGPKFYPEEHYDYFEYIYGEDEQLYTAVHVEKNKLIIEAKNMDGEVVDSFELK